MDRFFFADNTVLINFEILDRWDLIADLVGEKARWVGSIEAECTDWVETYPSIHTNASVIFGEAVLPESAGERVSVRTLRDDLATVGDHARKHLGEAETIVIMEGRFHGSFFVTDDHDAQRAAAAREIVCIGTGDLLNQALKKGHVDAREHAGVLEALKVAGRHPATFHPASPGGDT